MQWFKIFIFVWLLWLLCLFIVAFVESPMKNWWNEKQNLKYKIIDLGKITQLKLISNNKNDIVQFIMDNSKFLPQNMIEKLVARIELLDSEDTIYNHSRLGSVSEKQLTGLTGQLDGTITKK